MEGGSHTTEAVRDAAAGRLKVGREYWWLRPPQRVVRVRLHSILPPAPPGTNHRPLAPGQERRLIVIGLDDPFVNTYALVAPDELVPVESPR